MDYGSDCNDHHAPISLIIIIMLHDHTPHPRMSPCIALVSALLFLVPSSICVSVCGKGVSSDLWGGGLLYSISILPYSHMKVQNVVSPPLLWHQRRFISALTY